VDRVTPRVLPGSLHPPEKHRPLSWSMTKNPNRSTTPLKSCHACGRSFRHRLSSVGGDSVHRRFLKGPRGDACTRSGAKVTTVHGFPATLTELPYLWMIFASSPTGAGTRALTRFGRLSKRDSGNRQNTPVCGWYSAWEGGPGRVRTSPSEEQADLQSWKSSSKS
jgi:hypothetical protein